MKNFTNIFDKLRQYPQLQKITTSIIIFLVFFAVSFSYRANKTVWYWEKYPFFAILLILLALFFIKIWLLLEKQKQILKIEQLKQLLHTYNNSLKYEKIENTSKINDNKNEIKNPKELLSISEQVVLYKILEGKTNKEIAEELFIELSTVKTHINNIYKTLNINNRKSAILMFKHLIE
jgi:DNA-binding CsgD family transcriptional regulator